jgi:hypothetical protein
MDEHGTCYVVIPRGGPVRDVRAYRRHKVAHCNGWSDHHHHHHHADALPNLDFEAR